MKKIAYAILFAVIAIPASPPAFAQDTAESTEFVQKAGVGNLFEIQSSELALEKAQREDVRNFARLMIADHSAAAGEMTAALTEAGLDPTSVPEVLDPQHAAALTELQVASGIDFDREYIRVQKTAHDEAIDLFQDYMNNGDNMRLRQFAAATLPTLQQHREMVYQFTEVAQRQTD